MGGGVVVHWRNYRTSDKAEVCFLFKNVECSIEEGGRDVGRIKEIGWDQKEEVFYVLTWSGSLRAYRVQQDRASVQVACFDLGVGEVDEADAMAVGAGMMVLCTQDGNMLMF